MVEQPDLFGLQTVAGLPVKSGERVLSFGKYKSQPFEVLLADADYALWLLNSMHAKLESHYPELLAFLVARYGVPDRTPAHNRLQNRFLDETFAIQFAMAADDKFCKELLAQGDIDLGKVWGRYVRWVFDRELERLAQKQRWEEPSKLSKLRDMLLAQTVDVRFLPSTGSLEGHVWVKPVQVYDLEFERAGSDVALRVGWSGTVVAPAVTDYAKAMGREHDTVQSLQADARFKVEIKPIVGDDYPAILRAMKSVKGTHLLVGEYCGASASWDELVRVFSLSGITAVRLGNVDDQEPPGFATLAEIKPIREEDARQAVQEAYAEAESRLVEQTQ